MASEQNTISVAITANATGLSAGLKDAAAQVDKSSQAMRSGLQAAGGAAASVAKEHTGLVGTLKAYKAEQVQDARVARYYAGELAGIVPAAGAAGSAVQDLMQIGLEGAAGGFGRGLGIEVAGFALKTLSEKLVAHEEKLKALRKVGTDTFNAYADAMQGVRRGLEGPLTKTLEAHKDQVLAVGRNARTSWDEIRELARESGGFWDSMKRGLSFGIAESADDKIKDKLALMAKAKATVSGPKAKAELDRTAALESIEIEREVKQQIVSIRASTGSEIQRIDAETAAKRANLVREMGKYDGHAAELDVAIVTAAEAQKTQIRRAARLAERSAEVAAYKSSMSMQQANEADSDLRIRALKDQHRKGESASESKHIDAMIALERAAFEERKREIKELRALKDLQSAAELEAALAADAAHKKAEKDADAERITRDLIAKNVELAGSYQTIGQAAGDALGKMVTGADSVSGAMAGVLQTLVSVATGYMITAKVGLLANETSKLGVFGIISGIAGIAAVGAIASALINQIPHHADGGNYGPGPMLVGERGPEIINPGGYGTVTPNHKLGGAVNITIQALDGASVQRVVESDAFRLAMREARRNGRA